MRFVKGDGCSKACLRRLLQLDRCCGAWIDVSVKAIMNVYGETYNTAKSVDDNGSDVATDPQDEEEIRIQHAAQIVSEAFVVWRPRRVQLSFLSAVVNCQI